jgi:uncharacterized damage-inducible protein DinB
MAMTYRFTAITDGEIPHTAFPFGRHMLQTYASETNKVVSVWRELADADLGFRVHPRASSVGEILKHQLLSERRFFGEFLGTPEPAPVDVLPAAFSAAAYAERLVDLARPRLRFLAERDEAWWLETVPFFEVERERVWVFWRRVLHTAHHRTQLTVCLRVMGRAVPATYGPTADESWDGADPTHTVDAAGRR